MVNQNGYKKHLKKFIHDRKGTAEVVGSVLFIVILMFAFSNIYLWHDNATKSMNTLLSEKLNSQIEVFWDEDAIEKDTLIVTNIGGVNTILSRLWITTSSEHLYADLENIGNTIEDLSIPPGGSIRIELEGSDATSPVDSGIDPITGDLQVKYTPKDRKETFTVLTSLGNMASPKGQIKIVDIIGGGGTGGNAPVGSVIVADFSSFSYYTVDGNTRAISSYQNDFMIDQYGRYVGFSVILTNRDEKGRDITLDKNSQMFFIGQKNSQMVGYVKFFISSTNTAQTVMEKSYVPIILKNGQSIEVSFASSSPENFVAKDFNNIDSGLYPLNLGLIGDFNNGASFGQNIPFVSAYIEVK